MPGRARWRKYNRVAVLVGNEALTALQWFTLDTGFITGGFGSSIDYNDVLSWVYDALFDLNVQVDFVSDDDTDLGRYDLIVVSALLPGSAGRGRPAGLGVRGGGHLVTTLRTAVPDEHVQVWHDTARHGLTEVAGLTYNQFMVPDGVGLTLHGDLAGVSGADAASLTFMARLRPEGAEVLAAYDHTPGVGQAAVTRHRNGAGSHVHVGTMTSPARLLKPV